MGLKTINQVTLVYLSSIIFFATTCAMRFARLGIVLLLFVCFAGLAQAQTFQTKAPQALLMDADTGTILFAKEADTKIPPASLAKLMTMEVVFNRLKNDALKLDDKFFVSENAWKKGGANSGGSTMFANLKDEIALEDLIRGVIIQSANDGCIIIAEGLAGSEAAFANLMNERARAVGLKGSVFRNATGLPDPGQKVTITDLAKLARHMIDEYPQYYKYYSEPEFKWNKILQRNRNPLLSMDIGADGFKTGYTEESGYAIVGTAVREGQRLIAVLSGMKSKGERAEESRKILDWGFRAFEKRELVAANQVIADVSIYGGDKASIGVLGKDKVEIYLPIGSGDFLKTRVSYNYPLMPPIKKGDQVAILKVWVDKTLTQETPLYAAEDVEKGGIVRRATDAFQELLTGWIPN